MVTFSDCSPDEFDPPQTRPSHDFLLFLVILVLFVILAAVLFFCPLWMIEKLRLLGHGLTGVCPALGDEAVMMTVIIGAGLTSSLFFQCI